LLVAMKDHRDSATADPPHGGKGGYRPISVTLPPADYETLIQESARRKIAGEPNQLLSGMLREAVSDYLNRIAAKTSNRSTTTRDHPHKET
jgi:hypothetical protein